MFWGCSKETASIAADLIQKHHGPISKLQCNFRENITVLKNFNSGVPAKFNFIGCFYNKMEILNAKFNVPLIYFCISEILTDRFNLFDKCLDILEYLSYILIKLKQIWRNLQKVANHSCPKSCIIF